MTLRLTSVVRCDHHDVAAICDSKVHGRAGRSSIAAWGSLAPRAILVMHNGALSVFTPNGTRLAEDGIPDDLGDLCAEFRATVG